jgi:glycine/D-amino acid oxidase-like deaminating enzyme
VQVVIIGAGIVGASLSFAVSQLGGVSCEPNQLLGRGVYVGKKLARHLSVRQTI